MKKISILLAIFLAVPLFVRAQDAATEEQLNKLRGELTALQASNVDLQKRLADVMKELQDVKELASTPKGNYASVDDVKQLGKKIKEVDDKRVEDVDLIKDEIKKLGTVITSSNNGGGHGGSKKKPDASPKNTNDTPPPSDKGFEYVIQSGDTLSAIVAEYNKKGVKVTTDQVLKANPGLKAESLKVNQKIFIPGPPPK